ncbi:hypothetical protein [Bacillus thuringiensis]|uniref:Uncharacterized protein n=1 Tax=Bacillus thuringiensis TaxID=1428 RepID=A0A9X6ZQG5_BACTU|nr:hypothetical protein [Bacillus thuringiensis]PFJ32323.1 hypothetical protein COJ15_29065 [Bacillus thuringiensis]
MYYKTELDGFRTIYSEDAINPEQYITIYDEIYEDDNALFKVKNIHGNKLNATLVKVLNLSVVPEENQLKPSQLYQFENVLLSTEGRVNKNQVISFNKEFYTVKDIVKQNGPKGLVLEKIEYVATVNMYTIYRYKGTGGNQEEFQILDNYKDALIQLSKLREQKDDYFYRFR